MKYLISLIIIVIVSTIIFRLSFMSKYKIQESQYRLEICAYDDSWGYNIYFNNQLLIHQTQIPAISGRNLIQNKETAKKLGMLVIDKLSRNEVPTLSKEEIYRLNLN